MYLPDASQFPRVVSILASAGRVMEIQDLQVENRIEEKALTQNVGVRADDISFGYNRDTVIKSGTFDIEPGQTVAIVGESGIGKTTLIRLLLGFVSIGGGDISYYDSQGEKVPVNANVREFIAYVPQGNTLFSGTLRSNLLMGKPDATQEEIDSALELAGCRSFIDEMPDGIDTVIGEKGVGLSEGQAQRIAIARAIIRKSPFMIMDEATSALDEKTELEVISSLQKLSPRPTCLFITHRRSVLQYCDRQLRIEDGVITEEAVGNSIFDQNSI